MNHIPVRLPRQVVFKKYARDLDLFDRDLRPHRPAPKILMSATSADKSNQQSSMETAGNYAGKSQAVMPALLLLHQPRTQRASPSGLECAPATQKENQCQES